jgi:hypothetical protein
VIVLAIPYGSLSSLPSAQNNTPVVLFISSPAPHTAENKPLQANGSVTLPGLIEQLVALELLSSKGKRQAIEPRLVALASSPQQDVAEDGEPQANLDLCVPMDDADLPAPPPLSRAALLAMTDKILQENRPLPNETGSSARAMTIRAVIACAAVQTAWLALRHFATGRDLLIRKEWIELPTRRSKSSE